MTVRRQVAHAIAGRWPALNEFQRSLLAPLADDRDRRVREALADGLARNGRPLDPDGRKLLKQVRASLENY